jgi:hypothetical protein
LKREVGLTLKRWRKPNLEMGKRAFEKWRGVGLIRAASTHFEKGKRAHVENCEQFMYKRRRELNLKRGRGLTLKNGGAQFERGRGPSLKQEAGPLRKGGEDKL